MAISQQEKETILELLQTEVAPQKSVIFVTTKDAKEALNSESNFDFRKSARQEGVVLRVVKNTLLSRVFDLPELSGQTIVAYLEDKDKSDEVTVPKTVVDIIDDKFKEQLSVLGAVVNGEYFDADKTKVLAQTPTKDQSLAQMAGMLQSITSKIAIGVKEIPTSVARGVSEYSKTL